LVHLLNLEFMLARKRSIYIVLFSSVLVLSALTSAEAKPRYQYPASVVENFIKGCTSTGTKPNICSCAIDKIQDKYSFEEFYQIAEKARSDKQAAGELVSIAFECVPTNK